MIADSHAFTTAGYLRVTGRDLARASARRFPVARVDR
jgi:hypothetical protein